MLSWGDKQLADDTREFVSSLAEQWVDEVVAEPDAPLKSVRICRWGCCAARW